MAARGLSAAQIEVALDCLARNPFGSPKSSSRVPRVCACGCDGLTRGGKFRPGHDAKLLSKVLTETRNAMNAIVTEDATQREPLAEVVSETEYANLD